jgi:hypothetical protein
LSIVKISIICSVCLNSIFSLQFPIRQQGKTIVDMYTVQTIIWCAVVCVQTTRASAAASCRASGDNMTYVCREVRPGYPRVIRVSCASKAVRPMTLIWWWWIGGSATGVPRSAPFVRIINKEIFERKSGVFCTPLLK